MLVVIARTAWVLIACLAISAPVLAGPFKINRVFGPEIKTGPYKHPATVSNLDNGDLFLCYYGGEGEYEGDTKVFGSRLKKGSSTWSHPVIIADTPWLSEGNGVVWQAPDGLFWLYYLNRYGDTWSESRIRAKVSHDRGETWMDPIQVTWEKGTMVCNHPILLNDGGYLLPVYHETGHDTEKVGADSTSFFIKYDPKSHTWTETERIKSKNGNIQPSVVQMTDDHLVAYCRRGGGYEPEETGYIVRSESHDGGMTWSEGVDSKFPNPNADVEFKRLKSGNLILVYNDCMNGRSPLTIAVSLDGDKSWPYKVNVIDAPDGDFAYPSLVQDSDGLIHLVFTSEGRTVVNHATFTEAELLKAAGVK